ncbi:hypothetical protein [Dactylosporangium sp. NPDC051484]|uniref:hypothetical protein n=1 Tax=Dactylosporangium sp. NPDC051484 TaxID=3154942 RepID=UPI003450183A
MTLPRLRRIQWVLRAALVFALVISMAANVLHAEHDPIAQGVAAWSPIALFVAIEVMMRVPIRSRLRAGLRIVATAAIAGIAAWTSYWHMVGVVGRYETGLVPYLLPVSVDGLIIVLSVSLFDVASQLRERLDTAPETITAAAPVSTPPAEVEHETAIVPAGPAVTPAIPIAASLDDRIEPGNIEPDGDSEHAVARHDENMDEDADEGGDGEADPRPGTEPDGNGTDLAADLVPLLPAARAARDELLHEGSTVSRDALAARLRRNGTPIRNTRVSELLAALKAEHPAITGARQKAPV